MSVFKTDAEGVEQEVSRESVARDIESYAHSCKQCGRFAFLVPLDWDTPGWAQVVCPACGTEDWIEVYA